MNLAHLQSLGQLGHHSSLDFRKYPKFGVFLLYFYEQVVYISWELGYITLMCIFQAYLKKVGRHCSLYLHNSNFIPHNWLKVKCLYFLVQPLFKIEGRNQENIFDSFFLKIGDIKISFPDFLTFSTEQKNLSRFYRANI